MEKRFLRLLVLSLALWSGLVAEASVYDDIGDIKAYLHKGAPKNAGFYLNYFRTRFDSGTILRGCLETIYADETPENAKKTAARMYVFTESAEDFSSDIFGLMEDSEPYVREAALDIFRIVMSRKSERASRVLSSWRQLENYKKQNVINLLFDSAEEDPSSLRSVARTVTLIERLFDGIFLCPPMIEEYFSASVPFTPQESAAAKALTLALHNGSRQYFLATVNELREWERPILDVYIAEALRARLRATIIFGPQDDAFFDHIQPGEISYFIKILLDTVDRKTILKGIVASSAMVARLGSLNKEAAILTLKSYLGQYHDEPARNRAAALSLSFLERKTSLAKCLLSVFWASAQE